MSWHKKRLIVVGVFLAVYFLLVLWVAEVIG